MTGGGANRTVEDFPGTGEERGPTEEGNVDHSRRLERR